jgi:regulator of protease activity HflC (stomatin/prohibitin superfamily)
MLLLIVCIVVGGGLSASFYFHMLERHNDAQREKKNAAYEKAVSDNAKTFSFEADAFKTPLFEIGLIFGLSFLIGFGMASFTIVSAGHQGVQVTMGEVNMQTLNEGFHFVNPISDIHDVSVRVTKAELKNANAGTKDLQIVHTDIVVNYRLDGNKIAHVYKEFGLELEDKILLPAVNESFKAVTAHYNSEELVTKRDEVSHAINEALQTKVAKYGLIVSEISLVNFGFSAEYQAAIERKVIATQQKLKAEQDLARITIEAEQNVAKAKGEAESIRIQAQAIQQQGGKDYVQLQAIGKWDGKLPTYMMGNATPMINIKD